MEDYFTPLTDAAAGLTIEAIAAACSDSYEINFSRLRCKLAQLWDEHADNLPELFRQIYLDSLCYRISQYEYGGAGEIEDLSEFEECNIATNNPFLSPMLLFASTMLDWQEIASRCLDIFFGPRLMGQFSGPSDALDYYSEYYANAMLIYRSEIGEVEEDE